jgi:dihydroneopterin aldolase
MSIHPLRALDPAETFAADAAARGLIEVFLEGLVVRAHIGVYAHEKGRSQPIEVDIRIWAALSVGSDEIASTVNYETPARIAKDLGQTIHHQLIETYLAALIDAIMQDPPGRSGCCSRGKARSHRRRSRGWGGPVSPPLNAAPGASERKDIINPVYPLHACES